MNTEHSQWNIQKIKESYSSKKMRNEKMRKLKKNLQSNSFPFYQLLTYRNTFYWILIGHIRLGLIQVTLLFLLVCHSDLPRLTLSSDVPCVLKPLLVHLHTLEPCHLAQTQVPPLTFLTSLSGFCFCQYVLLCDISRSEEPLSWVPSDHSRVGSRQETQLSFIYFKINNCLKKPLTLPHFKPSGLIH